MLFRVCKISELQERKPMKFNLAEKKIEVVIIKINNKVYAIDAYCPHKGGNMEYGEIVYKNEYRIRCHLHSYEYSLDNGKLMYNPYGNKTGKWYYSGDLMTYETKIIDNDIFINI
ncbi:Rieske (2Fe-2S) protein [Acidianus manzaensis]|uniref:Rieske (2Fe-2S) protein n=1 Tax=Acidianus manzaensis TaxID=282676 RepID=A0A1W6JYL2_9CREN|nr:Rieske (2Fe-2S) protein [Acidianus manzaensis]ARM75337.1 Rieske (2Fe-2S) protein [Acidianus manzaensis]